MFHIFCSFIYFIVIIFDKVDNIYPQKKQNLLPNI